MRMDGRVKMILKTTVHVYYYASASHFRSHSTNKSAITNVSELIDEVGEGRGKGIIMMKKRCDIGSTHIWCEAS